MMLASTILPSCNRRPCPARCRWIVSNRHLPNLCFSRKWRKFKIVVAVPPSNDVDIYAHDLGFIAIVEGGEIAGLAPAEGDLGRQARGARKQRAH